jgi:hypothetical protein
MLVRVVSPRLVLSRFDSSWKNKLAETIEREKEKKEDIAEERTHR